MELAGNYPRFLPAGQVSNLSFRSAADSKPAPLDSGVDRTVQHELEMRLRSCLFHAARSVSSEFHEGVVILRGHVGNYHEKQMAQELVRKVKGVKIVVNRLVVDSAVASEVRAP